MRYQKMVKGCSSCFIGDPLSLPWGIDKIAAYDFWALYQSPIQRVLISYITAEHTRPVVICPATTPNNHNMARNESSSLVTPAMSVPTEVIIEEQPNGQFQITENGALNLMKADSMGMLVINNLAQDLSVAKETNVVDEINIPSAAAEDIVPEMISVSSGETLCCSNDSQLMGDGDSGFLSSLSGTITPPCIDSDSAVIAVPQMEVLTNDLTSLREKPNSPEVLTSRSSNSSPIHSSSDILFKVKFCYLLQLNDYLLQLNDIPLAIFDIIKLSSKLIKRAIQNSLMIINYDRNQEK